jgi:hypothetical protein
VRENLWAAFLEVKANRRAAGVDHQTVEDFVRHRMKSKRLAS